MDKLKKKYEISPSILSADFSRLGNECSEVIKAGADRIHFDVMDNHYVQNLTVGPLVCKSLRDYGIKCPIDIHLMTIPVDNLILDFLKVGASSIIFHPEASNHVDRSINLINDMNCKSGIALNPSTSICFLEYLIEKIDFILIMTVNPGFAAQKFISNSFNKIKKVKKIIKKKNPKVKILVDGGVNLDNLEKLFRLGVDIFVMGNEIFSKKNYYSVISNIKNKLKKCF